MSLTIPYDPSLVLGNIVTQAKLDNLIAMSAVQASVDAAEDKLNSYISLKRSVDMTIQELMDMDIDPEDLIKESIDIGAQIKDAAVEFAKIKLSAEKQKQPLKAKIQSISQNVESPIDYNKSKIISIPLSSDSLQMNCQYFSVDENAEDSNSHVSSIASFVGDSVDVLGDRASASAKASAQSQVSSQQSRHSIAGTLVISITCTHKQAALFAPFIIDVDKAIRSWNKLFPDSMIKTNSVSSMLQIQAESNTKAEESLTLLSGATYGSCFIGMVHVLNVTDSKSSEAMYSIAESLKGSFEVGGWFADETGSFGVDSSFSNDAKNLLSAQNISTHCTLTSLGSIPSIKSNQVKMAVKSFSDIDPGKTMEKLAALQNSTASAGDSIANSAQAAKAGQQSNMMAGQQIKSVLSGLSDIDDGSNKIVDVNSLMTAMEDYTEKCLAGNIGIPINFYTKEITKSELAQMWLAKYYPNKYNQAGSGDDSTPNNGNNSQEANP